MATTKSAIYGLHAVFSVLQLRPNAVLQLYCLQGKTDARLQEIQTLAQTHGHVLQAVSRQTLDQLAATDKHQGVVAIGDFSGTLNEHDLLAYLEKLTHDPLLLILDSLEDPRNLGACLRVADGAGVDGVIIPKSRGVALTPVVRKVAAGALDAVPVFEVGNLARTIRALKQQGIWCVGTAGEADQSLYEADFKGPLALVMGNEGQGLRRLTKEQCDFLVNLPMLGYVSSLNVSVATGIVLYEALRQRRA